jgi:hypothetical protein
MARSFKTPVSVEGDISTTGKLNVNASAGDEGGEIFLANAVTNTTISGGVTIDVYQNKLRFFEQGGTARGYYIDITGGGATAGTNLIGTASSVVGTVTGTSTTELVRGNMADNDQFRILVGGTATNAGYVELATADDGTEPIYVRQYTGVFTTIARTATLLDGSGNTSFPGTVSATSFNSITGLSSTTPSADGTAAVGTATTAARADHVHPTTGLGLTSGTLAQFAATTSAQLLGVISDETGSGSLVFATSPVLTSPNVTTSLITSSTSFDLLNTVATTVNFAGAATSLTISTASSASISIGQGGGSTVYIANNGSSTANIGNSVLSGNTRTINIGSTALSNSSAQTINIAAATSISGTSTVNIGASATLDTTLLNLYGRITAGSLTLRSGTATANTAPLYFGNTSPALLTTPAVGAREFDGIAFYSTPNATTGRAVDVASYYYVSDGSYAADFSATATAKPIFGSATTGLTLIAGTTYEFELNVYTSVTAVGTSALAKSHSFLLTTVSGSPTTTIYQQISLATNTTSLATASTPTTLRNINNATVTVLAATTAGTSRYSIYNVKGIIRVTGTGSVEIAPAATSTGVEADYTFIAAAGSYIFIRPIGNGTVTNVGSAWA